MKFMKSISFGMLLFGALAFSACNNGGTNTDNGAGEKQGPEYTSAYICPMHCEGSGSEEPGKCPKCGMDYVKNEEHKHEGHDHDDHNHEH